jgi:hypothetical protein
MWYTSDVNRPSHTAALDRLLDPFSRILTPEFAKKVAGLRADPATQVRIDELADKCNEGQLTPEEEAEYTDYVEVIDLIGILQAKARAVLTKHASP